MHLAHTANRISSFLFLLLLCTLPYGSYGQRTLKHTDPQSLYQKGLELYDAGHYGSAEKVFKDYLASKDDNRLNQANARYFIAVSAVELFQDDAQYLLSQFASEHPDHPYARLVGYHLGKFHFRNNDYEEAANAFAQVEPGALSDKQASEYYLMSGYVNFKTDKLPAAKEAFSRVKNIPGDLQPFASYYYGYISYKEGKYTDALLEFEKIKDEKRFRSQIPVYLAQIYLLQGNYDKVISYGEEVLSDKENEKAGDIRLYVGEAYFRKKNYAQAISTYRAYTGTLPEHHLYQLGYSQFVQGLYPDAIASLSHIGLKEDSLSQNITFHLAHAYVKTGEKLRARTAYDYAAGLKFIPAIQEQSRLNSAKLNYELGFQKESIDALRQFTKTYPNSKYLAEAQELLGGILMSADNPEEALQILKSLPNRNRKLNEAYQKILYSLAIDYIYNEEYEEAEKHLRESLTQPLDKKIRAEAYFWLGELAFKKGDYQEAAKQYKNFLAVPEGQNTPYYAVTYYNLGYCNFKTSVYNVAGDYFRRYLEAEKGRKPGFTGDAQVRLADCYYMARNWSAALTAYDKASSAGSTQTDYALYQKAMIYEITGKPNEQIATLKQLIGGQKNSNLLDDAYFALATAYNNMGNFKEAITFYEALNKRYAHNPYFRLARLQIGQAYDNMHETDKAKSVFVSIIKTYPHSDEAKQAYRFLQRIVIESGDTEALENLKAEIPEEQFEIQSPDSVFFSTAYTNYVNGNCDAAVKSFKNYLTKFRNAAFATDAYYYMAVCELQKGQKMQALEHFNAVVARMPNQYHENALRYSAELYFEDKNYEKAKSRYDTLRVYSGQRENTQLAMLGSMRSAFFLKDYESAASSANDLLAIEALDPAANTQARYYLAKSQLELNQLDQALAGFTQLYKDDKSEIGAESVYQAAYVLFLKDRYKDAEKLILEQKDNFKIYDYWRAKEYILVADIYIKNGDDFQARGILESVLKGYKAKDDVRTGAQERLNEIEAREKGGNK